MSGCTAGRSSAGAEREEERRFHVRTNEPSRKPVRRYHIKEQRNRFLPQQRTSNHAVTAGGFLAADGTVQIQAVTGSTGHSSAGPSATLGLVLEDLIPPQQETQIPPRETKKQSQSPVLHSTSRVNITVPQD